jgi:hypothetical protein
MIKEVILIINKEMTNKFVLQWKNKINSFVININYYYNYYEKNK